MYLVKSTTQDGAAWESAGISLETRSVCCSFKNNAIKHNIANLTDGHGGGIYCSDSKVFITQVPTFQIALTFFFSKFVISDNDGSGDGDENLYCSQSPGYTWCTVKGDSNWSSKCGEPDYNDNNGGSPLKRVLMIAGGLGAAGLLLLLYQSTYSSL